MSSPRQTSRRVSHSQRQTPESDDTLSLNLTRTLSHELSIGEGVAVQEIDPEPDSKNQVNNSNPPTKSWPASVRYFVLLCGLFTSISFGFTQVPIIYVLRLMSCEIYYKNNPGLDPNTAQGLATNTSFVSLITYALNALSQSATVSLADKSDRCAIRAIDTSTALQFSLLAASTTVFGIANLFLCGILIKRIGLKETLIIQVGFPAARLFVQNVAVTIGGRVGIIVMQCSQVASVLGGPSGYMLVLNTFMTEVVDPDERTASLGRLAGSMMFGTAIGFLLGGLVAARFNIRTPFRVTFMLFLFSCLYSIFFLPKVPKAKAKETDDSTDSKPKQSRLAQFFGPLFVFGPKKFITQEGKVQTEYGAFLIACGVFLGILATSFVQSLLQLYATDMFGFNTDDNGWLIFIYASLRGVFLTFAFPVIIAFGRKLMAKRKAATPQSNDSSPSEVSERDLLLPTARDQNQSEPQNAHKKDKVFQFDLIYTRGSLLADGLLTLLCTFVRQGWQMYLVAAILPFSAGTGSAAKGTILQMIGSSAAMDERTDALAGISLIENIARLSTTFVFGLAFAAFASIGRLELVFTCNAGIAIIGFLVLLGARFPPEGSKRVDKEVEVISED